MLISFICEDLKDELTNLVQVNGLSLLDISFVSAESSNVLSNAVLLHPYSF